MTKKFFKELDRVKKSILKFLDDYSKSQIMQNYFFDKFISFVYGTLIGNFFSNLTLKKITRANLPKGRIRKINKKFKPTIKEVKLALLLKPNKINQEYYNIFKERVKKNFPPYTKIIGEIERIVKINKVRKYFKKTKSDMKKAGKSDNSMNSFFIVKILEMYIQKKKTIPTGGKIQKIIKEISKDVFPKFSKEIVKNLDKSSKKMLNHQRKFLKGFEKRLYSRWEKAIDLLECLIKVSLESGEGHKHKLKGEPNPYKTSALIRIHARALQISNEILVLLKSGYPDGANARWRSLHELSIISFFLLNNNDDVAKRYLEHSSIKRFKLAKEYRTYYKKLGYRPIQRKEFNKVKREKERLCREYNDRFQEEYGWIPSNILSDRNFRALEQHVKLDKLRPFYSMSSDSVHGGSKGFYRLGLIDKWQDKVLMVGPSNYGLADPLQGTALSILHISICLLNLKPDFGSIIQMQVMNNYVQRINSLAAKIQKQIEKDERKLQLVLSSLDK